VGFAHDNPFFPRTHKVRCPKTKASIGATTAKQVPMASVALSNTSGQSITSQQQQLSNQFSPVLKDLAQSLDKAHTTVSDMTAASFQNTRQALDQTSVRLQTTAKSMEDSSQNLTRYQSSIKALVARINEAKEFLPMDDSHEKVEGPGASQGSD
jgi:DNA repair ATPase RecN